MRVERNDRENKGARRSEGSKMRNGSRKWECMLLFTLGHMLVERSLLSD